MIRIVPKCQQYAWGKVGSSSLVANLALGGSEDGMIVDEDKPYAELWMGTHPSGPSLVSPGGQLLSDWLKENPGSVGRVPSGYGSDDLPFLLKVLSIKTALSIQAHPDKKLAEELHSNFPTVYKDANHKPEMAIALTKFEGMNGFRPLAEIHNHCQLFPELATILGAETVAKVKEAAPVAPKDTWEIKDRVYILATRKTPIVMTLPTGHTQKRPLLWFDEQKGFGFIEQEDGADLFVHHSEVKGGALSEGDSVEYDVGEGQKGPCAKNVSSVG